jgi:hypothetical protein
MKKIYCFGGGLVLLLWLWAGAALAQSKPPVTITGKITAAKTNETLPGVTVLLKGTTNGTATGADGSYSLQVPGGEGTLIFSFVGYVKREIPLGGKTSVSLSLDPDDNALDDVVVVGYGTQKAGNVTGAVAGITAKEIEERPVNRIENALVG